MFCLGKELRMGQAKGPIGTITNMCPSAADMPCSSKVLEDLIA